MTNRSSAVHAFVLAVAGIGAAAVWWTLTRAWAEGLGDLRVLGLAVVALSFGVAFPLRFKWKGESEDVSIDEAFYIVLVMSSPPAAVVAAAFAANLVGQVYHRRAPIKAAFNLGLYGTSVTAALAVSAWVAGDLPTGAGWRGIAAAVAGGVTFYTVTTLGVRAVVAIADELDFGSLFRNMSAFEAVAFTSSASLGVLTGLASSAQTAALLFAFAPLAAVGFVLQQYARSIRDRQQVDLLLDAAMKVKAAPGVAQVHAVVSEAACRLLRTTEARIQLERPAAGEIGSMIERAGDELWLVAGPDAARGASALALLDGLAAVASAALASAELLDRVRHQAFHDVLTGLPNRFLFEDRVNQAIRAAGDTGVGLLFMDLDRFKRFNDNLGRARGDELLREVSERLAASLGEGDSAARIGGDEFAVLVPAPGDEGGALDTARRVQCAMRAPFHLGSDEVFVTGSIGVATSPVDGDDFESLLHAADAAMYEAKQAGRDSIRVRSAGPDAGEMLALEADLRHAVEHGGLWVAYQPQVDLHSGDIVGAEALVRWLHPTRGPMGPDQFLPLAEQLGLLGDIDTWVLGTACAEAASWPSCPAGPRRVSVNVSEGRLRSRAVEVVIDALARAGLPPSCLEVEVTEKVTATDEDACRALEELRALGVRVAVDDFGTGYSSLSRLQQLPIDVVKIDRSFIREILDATSPAPIVSSTITLARGLGLLVVAEGVETVEQLRFLEAHDCDLVQGFLLGRPVPAEQLREHMLERIATDSIESTRSPVIAATEPTP